MGRCTWNEGENFEVGEVILDLLAVPSVISWVLVKWDRRIQAGKGDW